MAGKNSQSSPGEYHEHYQDNRRWIFVVMMQQSALYQFRPSGLKKTGSKAIEGET
jgi:hypothetical protein